MWRLSLIANVLIMWLLWMISIVPIGVVYNRFKEHSYEGQTMYFPSVTELAFSSLQIASAIPVVWTLVAMFFGSRIRKMETVRRNEYLLVFTTVTLAIGLSLVCFFLIAAVLPFLLL